MKRSRGRGRKPNLPATLVPPELEEEQGPENETRHDKFLRLGVARINRTLTNIRLIGNLASINYEYTTEDVDAIRASLMSAIEAMLNRFSAAKKPAAPSFTFDQRQKLKE